MCQFQCFFSPTASSTLVLSSPAVPPNYICCFGGGLGAEAGGRKKVCPIGGDAQDPNLYFYWFFKKKIIFFLSYYKLTWQLLHKGNIKNILNKCKHEYVWRISYIPICCTVLLGIVLVNILHKIYWDIMLVKGAGKKHKKLNINYLGRFGLIYGIFFLSFSIILAM